MPASNNSQKGMPDMSNLLESLIGEMPGMKELPPEERKKMKRAIKATSEKVQSLDLEGIFKNALSDGNGKHNNKKSSPDAILNAIMKDDSPSNMPPPPPTDPQQHNTKSKEKSKKKKNRNAKKKKPRTPDKQYQLNLSLEELFSGKTSKRLTVRVDRRVDITDEDREAYKQENNQDPPEGAYKYDNVKIKLPISDFLEAGMIDDDLIHFVGESDHAEGSETGDIIACIVQDQHDVFEREGNDLWILNNKVSLYESYVGGFKFVHLDGRLIEIAPKSGEPLHADGGLRCIKNAGMPIREEDEDDDGLVEDDENREAATSQKQEYGDLYVQFDLELPKTLDDENLELLKKICSTQETGAETSSSKDSNVNKLIESGVEPYKITVDKAEDPYDDENVDMDDSSDSDEDSDEEDSSTENGSESEDSDIEELEELEEVEGDETGEETEEEDDSPAAIAADKAAIELLMEEAKENGGSELNPEQLLQSVKESNGKKRKKSIKG